MGLTPAVAGSRCWQPLSPGALMSGLASPFVCMPAVLLDDIEDDFMMSAGWPSAVSRLGARASDRSSVACCRFDYVREHRERGITVIFANPSKKVVRQLEDARLVQHIGALFLRQLLHVLAAMERHALFADRFGKPASCAARKRASALL